MLKTTATAILIFATYFLNTTAGQMPLDSLSGKFSPEKYALTVGQKAARLEEKLVKKSAAVLSDLQRQEEKIYSRMLAGKDSLLAKTKLSEVREKYSKLKEQLKHPAIPGKARVYIAKLDSLNTSLKFLNTSGAGPKIQDALAKTESLQDKFAQAEEIKKFIRERKEMLKEQLGKLGMVKQLKKINKQVYYYTAQVKEYKEILKDPKKIEKKALALLAKNKLFQKFMKKHSLLQSLFPQPDDPLDPAYLASLGGLQTRVQISSLIQDQIAAGGPNAGQFIQQNLNAAQSELKQLKDKMLKMGSANSGEEMPEGFKPNGQKTKSFFKRLEFGSNFQSQKANGYFPVTTDLGLSVGYKLNEKSTIGIGGSYKLGLGSGIRHIKLTHEGVGLRSFIDWKIKGSFWMSGGYEMNYQTIFHDFDVLKDMNAWQQSGLLGLSKSIPIKTKFFGKTKSQILWDFLSYKQVPRTSPVKFRITYNFK